MELYKGRPEGGRERQERELRVYDLLDKLKIQYVTADHEEAHTMGDCLEIDRALGTQMCKNLFLCNRQKTKFYLLAMPGNKVFKTKELSSQIGSARLSFGSGEDMEKYLDIHPGAVSILGLMNDREKQVQLLVDEDVLKEEEIGCHPCVCTSSLKLKTGDVFGSFLEAVHHTYRTVHLTGE